MHLMRAWSVPLAPVMPLKWYAAFVTGTLPSWASGAIHYAARKATYSLFPYRDEAYPGKGTEMKWSVQ